MWPGRGVQVGVEHQMPFREKREAANVYVDRAALDEANHDVELGGHVAVVR